MAEKLASLKKSGRGIQGVISYTSSGWSSSGASAQFTAEVDAYYLMMINNANTISGDLFTSGATAAGPVRQDNYGGRCAIVQIIKATSTTITTRLAYTLYTKLYIEQKINMAVYIFSKEENRNIKQVVCISIITQQEWWQRTGKLCGHIDA